MAIRFTAKVNVEFRCGEMPKQVAAHETQSLPSFISWLSSAQEFYAQKALDEFNNGASHILGYVIQANFGNGNNGILITARELPCGKIVVEVNDIGCI